MLLFLPLSHLFLSFFSIPLKIEALSVLGSEANSCSLFCSLFQTTFKSDAGFGQRPLALGFCAAVCVRSYDL